jgi:V8-like Glu-specific endopeptidase
VNTGGAQTNRRSRRGNILAALQFLAFAQLCAAQDQRATTAEVMDNVERLGRARAAVEITRRPNDNVVLETVDQSLPVSNPEALKLPVTSLPATAVVTLDESTNKLRLEGYTLQATDRWNNLSTADKNRYNAVTQANAALAAAVSAYQAFGGDNPDAVKRDFFAKVNSATKSVVEEYGRLSSAARSTDRQLVEQYRILKKTGKAIYGYGDDRYPPEAYTRIYSNRVVALALGRPGESKSMCSATLIGNDLALTNHHCISSYLPGDLNARFDYEVNLEGNSLPQKVFPVAEYVINNDQQRAGLDFALLRLGANDEGQLPGSVYKPACLSSSRVQPFDPVYLIGHPLGEPRTVHDNAYVLFPFRITQDEYAELELNVRAEFLDTDDEQEQLTSFRSSYRQATLNNQPVYENFSTRFRQQPTIGADFDAYHGNSGSPAFNRRTHRVVGLLFDGEEDVSQPLRPGWRAHEALLPITIIMERLDVARPGWRGSPGVCIGS